MILILLLMAHYFAIFWILIEIDGLNHPEGLEEMWI